MARQARKNTYLVENVKEINQWYYTCKIGVRVRCPIIISYFLTFGRNHLKDMHH
jgi:hypothetical protein